jgi:AcrR family transcriptional regulator
LARPKGARDTDYEEKRQELLRRITLCVMRREALRPSFRQLAQAAAVSVPTLRYYFGDRPGVISAVLENFLLGDLEGLERVARPSGDFSKSIHDFGLSLVRAARAQKMVKLGDVFAIAIAEGLLDPSIGPAALQFIVDPTVDTLAKRLWVHVERGEMIQADLRAAALVLVSPLLLTILHQDHMGGATCNPADLNGLVAEVCDAFIRAYAAPVHA